MASIYDFLSKMSGGFLPQYTDPSKAAMPYLNKVPGTVTPYYDPYINSGKEALGNFSSQVGNLATPGGAIGNYNDLAKGYQESPGLQHSIQNAARTANQYAAAGGMAGSPTEQVAIANETRALSDEDFNNYMRMVSGYQTEGFGGESDIMHEGYNASQNLADILSKNLSERGAYAYGGAREKNLQNSAESNSLWNILGNLGGLAGEYGSQLLSVF